MRCDEDASRPMTDTPPVTMRELEDAFDFGDADELEAYLNVQTGEFVFIAPEGCLDEEPPDALEDEDKYLRMPDKRDLDLGSRLVFAFAREVGRHDEVREIFSRRGAYRRYKDSLDRWGLAEKWYAFQDAATKEALRGWCQENGIRVKEETG